MEMNLHLPRSYQTVVELEELAAVPTQIISPQGSKPVIGLVQDSMLAVFRWTLSDKFLNARQTMKLLAWTSTYNGLLPMPDDPKQGWKAHSIMSSILPAITHIKEDDDPIESVRIVHGKFESGVWSKDSVGGKISQIIHASFKDFGSETTRLLLDNLMNLTMQWLLIDGFSIGMVDTHLTDNTNVKINEVIDRVYQEIMDKIKDVREGKFATKFSNIGLSDQFENEMFSLVSKIRNEAQSIAYKSLNQDNRIYATVTSGSKGKPENLVQISSLLGQQGLEGGKRVHGGFSDRTLPHFSKYDLRPEAHGLILNNYLVGLTPTEYFMHAMSGREGVISTAIKTGITGYIQRKLIKVMEDLKVYYDNTIRNANHFIISHVYGGDSFDAAKLEREYFKYFNMDITGTSFKNEYIWTEEEIKNSLTNSSYGIWQTDSKNNFGGAFLKQEFEQILEDRRILIEDMYPHKTQHGQVYSPVNFSRLLDWVTYSCGLDKQEKADISPFEIIQKVNALIKDINVSADPEVSEICTRHFRFLIRNYLYSKKLITKYKFNSPALELTLLKIKQHYYDSLISPGEMIGCISAQSIGEPLTQLTLDSVAPHERLILQNKDGTTRLVKIGEWIDDILSKNPDKIKHFAKNKTEYLELDEYVWTPTPSKEAKFGWHKITAITRHLPGGDLVKITTKGGRSVTATKSKSLLVWKNGELVQIGGAEATIGDLTPVICDFPEPLVTIDHLDLRKYLSPNDVKSKIPEKFPLDQDFGTIVGLYLAEGWSTDTFVGISNNDKSIMTLIESWCDKYSITYHTVVSTNKRFKKSKSTDLKIHSVLLARWFKVWLGTGSANKRMPVEAFTSNLEFTRGILDGYFAGDGTVNKRDGYLCISSVSEDLITGFGVLCSRFGIMGKQSGHQAKKNNIGSKNIKYTNTYSIRNSFAQKWATEISSCHPEKARLMKENILTKKFSKPYGNYWEKVNSTILDPIVSIEEVPATEFVYDLTVPDTKNFSIWNGLGVSDTFHQSGMATRSKKLNEVPRLREIFSTTSNPKTPFINIFLKPETLQITDETSHEEVIRRGEQILDRIHFTTMNSLVNGYQILFDPNEKETIVADDQAWLKRAHEVFGYGDIETPWLIRLTFNSEKMQNITLQEIREKLDGISTDETTLYILFTPQNSKDVVMRIRVYTSSDDPKKELKDLMKKILTTQIKGMPNIMGGSITFQDRNITVNGKFISNKSAEYLKTYKYKEGGNRNEKVLNPMNQQYLIETEGTNLFDIMAMEGIFTYKTRTNDLHEVLEVLGIEATRKLIIEEIVDVFAFGGKSLNNRHLGLLSDIMTAQGYLVSIDRYGVNKTETGVLSRATFETTTNQIANASMFGEEDPLMGVSANIMFGQFFKGGTNGFDTMLDEEMIMDNADKLHFPRRLVRPKNPVEFQEVDTIASCQNLDFEFSL